MLILHQTGSVKVGEVVRYTLTYTPTLDRILPIPSHLYVKIKNTSLAPLRAAYLHGPYTLYVACYPSTFDPNKKHEKTKQEGVPEYEPQLKAGGSWYAKLVVPEELRQDADRAFHYGRNEEAERRSFTWIIEVASQVLFSTSAAVHFEVLIGRDEKSIDLGFHGTVGTGQGVPGRLEDHQQGKTRTAAQPRGVFSKAVRLAVDDTESLWNTPPFPEWDHDGHVKTKDGPHHGDKRDHEAKPKDKSRKRQKIHLVLVTHGLHSNTGADMLFVKESIDTAARKAKEDAKKAKAELRAKRLAESNDFGRDAASLKSKSTPDIALSPSADESTQNKEDDEDIDDDDEQVLVRGFTGNAVKTERGIQYLGKRMAKYVLSITYPDQPYLPIKSSISDSISKALPIGKVTPSPEGSKLPSHRNSTIIKDEEHSHANLPYTITSISFIAHSLGGLVQLYAVAYIQKHSPEFFQLIRPINFVAMATPFLGLSNENPVYVKFALDFGLVGRTGQDLGLTWRAPNIAKTSWGAMMGGLGVEAAKKTGQPDPGSKPILRILPTGPAHLALKKFRNRSVYANVVNDGIVPLRTSCLLFLDWRGLERVEKARRDNGLVGTMVEWGWAEMTGQNVNIVRSLTATTDNAGGMTDDEDAKSTNMSPALSASVPAADASEGLDFDRTPSTRRNTYLDTKPFEDEVYDTDKASHLAEQPNQNLWSGFLSFFKPQAAAKAHHHAPKQKKIYRRGQTNSSKIDLTDEQSESGSVQNNGMSTRGPVRGLSFSSKAENEGASAPPTTTIFESAGDLINPPLPPKEFLLDPAARPRTIFHDRVYHPEDIPPPPAKKQKSTFMGKKSSKDSMSSQLNSDAATITPQNSPDPQLSSEVGTMKIEEKIARAYHKDLTWRKVLVRLEPDAHNNMIVRRMFANAYGWPVVKHMCDTHFAYTRAARTDDEQEAAVERARPGDKIGAGGEEVTGQVEPPAQESPLDEGRSQTTDDFFSSSARDDTDDIHRNLSKLHSKGGSSNIHRTESEVRESRDEVAEMVSNVIVTGETSTNYSNMSSSKAALSKVAVKSDAAMWRDKFFEGSDNESEYEEDDTGNYQSEFQKAELRAAHRHSSTASTEINIARSLAMSPSSTRSTRQDRGSVGNEPTITGAGVLVAEPDEIGMNTTSSGGRSDSPRPVTNTRGRQQDQTLPSVATGSPAMTSLGLRKSIEEQVTTPPATSRGKEGEPTGLGLTISEHVATAQAKK